MSVLLLLGAILSAQLGCTMLALSQERHWRRVTNHTAEPGKVLRRAGWLLIATSLVMAILRDGPSFAVLSWPMHLGLSALITTAVLTWKPEVMKPFAKLGAPKSL